MVVTAFVGRAVLRTLLPLSIAPSSTRILWSSAKPGRCSGRVFQHGTMTLVYTCSSENVCRGHHPQSHARGQTTDMVVACATVMMVDTRSGRRTTVQRQVREHVDTQWMQAATNDHHCTCLGHSSVHGIVLPALTNSTTSMVVGISGYGSLPCDITSCTRHPYAQTSDARLYLPSLSTSIADHRTGKSPTRFRTYWDA